MMKKSGMELTPELWLVSALTFFLSLPPLVSPHLQ